MYSAILWRDAFRIRSTLSLMSASLLTASTMGATSGSMYMSTIRPRRSRNVFAPGWGRVRIERKSSIF